MARLHVPHLLKDGHVPRTFQFGEPDLCVRRLPPAAIWLCDDVWVLAIQATKEESLDLIDGIHSATSLLVTDVRQIFILAGVGVREFADRTTTLFLWMSFEPLLQTLCVELVATEELTYHRFFHLVVFSFWHPLHTEWAQAQITTAGILEDVVDATYLLIAHGPVVAMPPMHEGVIDAAHGKKDPSKTQDSAKSCQEDPSRLHFEIVQTKGRVAWRALEIHLDLSDCI